jgi:hypothetical protein
MGTLILVGIVALFVAGGLIKVHADGVEQGLAQCHAAMKAADDKLAAAAAALEQETANHISDMATAYDVGESKAKTRTIYVQTKGATDVQRNPALSSAACALPPDLKANLDAARAGIRREPPVAPSPVVTQPSVTSPAPAIAPTVQQGRPLGKRP